MCSRYHLRQCADDVVHRGTDTLLLGMNHFAGQQRYLFGLQSQVFQQVVIHPLHLLRPVTVARIRFSLMQQDALDDTLLLCLACQFH